MFYCTLSAFIFKSFQASKQNNPEYYTKGKRE